MMQKYTEKKIRDIKLARYKEADNALSQYGPVLIAHGNVGACVRKSSELYTIAAGNVINDIFECEKEALSSLGEIPSEQYLSELKNEIFIFVDNELPMWDVKLQQKLSPYTKTANFQIMQDKSGLFHDLISRKTALLKEEVILEKNRSDKEAYSITNNTVTNYGSIKALNQDQSISTTQDKTTIHSQGTGWLKKTSLVVSILVGLVMLYQYITGQLSPYLKIILDWF